MPTELIILIMVILGVSIFIKMLIDLRQVKKDVVLLQKDNLTIKKYIDVFWRNMNKTTIPK